MSTTATRDSVSTAAPEITWPCPNDVQIENQPAPRVRRRRGFIWGLITVCALVALFAGVSKIAEEELSHHNLPGISAPR
jgi:hypothetical protein